MLFPVGINQSYAQFISSFISATPEFDFASHAVIDSSCLDDAALTATVTGVSGSLGALSSTVACFEGERTWQAFILNADGDDDILDSKAPLTVTGTTDMHAIDFSDLDPEIDYRAVLLLTGSYNGGSGSFVADSSVYRIVEFTTLEVPVDDPTAPDQTIVVFSGTADEVTIPFSEFVPPVSGNTFEQLFITLSLGSNAQLFYTSFRDFTGTNATSLAVATSVLEVTGDTVTINNAFGATQDLLFDYTVTNTKDVSASGVITITFDRFVGDIMANPYTVTLADLSELPTVTRTILTSTVTSTILEGTKVFGPLISTFTFSDIGTGDAAVGESAIGNASGTLVVTNPTVSTGTMLAYTPVSGFAGTETFDYTVSLEGESDSSQFIFVVPVEIIANIHPITLPNLFGLPTIDLPITDTILAGSTLGAFTLADITFATNGTGNATGTLTVTDATSSSDPIFHYTPTMFGITEAFSYTATIGTDSGSSTLYIVTPAVLVCDMKMTPLTDFGDLSPGQLSGELLVELVNGGNRDVQPMLNGSAWVSDADDTMDVINVNQTKYALMAGLNYADDVNDDTVDDGDDTNNKISLTLDPVNVGEKVGMDSLTVYLQLKAKLMDLSFRGGITQELTSGFDCTG